MIDPSRTASNHTVWLLPGAHRYTISFLRVISLSFTGLSTKHCTAPDELLAFVLHCRLHREEISLHAATKTVAHPTFDDARVRFDLHTGSTVFAVAYRLRG